LAIRPLRPSDNATVEWAVVESKGTDIALAGRKTCPSHWSAQARNIVLAVNNEPVTPPRHMVVATRINPNAKRPSTRRLQIRAWNSSTETYNEHTLPASAAAEVASASLFGLFGNLGLLENALAIALSTKFRREVNEDDSHADNTRQILTDQIVRAEQEAAARTTTFKGPEPETLISSRAVRIESGRISADVLLAEALFEFSRKLVKAVEAGEMSSALRHADERLDAWYGSRKERDSVLPLGVDVRIRDFSE
jgi:hypothetical protein